MVRDLKVFEHFSPKDLFAPLTMPTVRVAVALNLVDDEISEHIRSAEKIKRWWKDHEAVHEAYVKIKQYAEKLFPDDHLKVDYPFFVLGRWLSGFELTREVLRKHLSFFMRARIGFLYCIVYYAIAYEFLYHLHRKETGFNLNHILCNCNSKYSFSHPERRLDSDFQLSSQSTGSPLNC